MPGPGADAAPAAGYNTPAMHLAFPTPDAPGTPGASDGSGPAAPAGPATAGHAGGPPGWVRRLGGRWWLVTAAVAAPGCGAAGFALSMGAVAVLSAKGLPVGDWATDELPRAALLCVWPAAFAAAVVVWTAPAPSARPFAVLCAAAAAWLSLQSGATDYQITQRGRGTGPMSVRQVWPVPLALGAVAGLLFLEHRHGRGSLPRANDDDAPTLRVFRG